MTPRRRDATLIILLLCCVLWLVVVGYSDFASVGRVLVGILLGAQFGVWLPNSPDASRPVGVADAPEFAVGASVEKVGGDYTFAGQIVAAFTKRSGAVRYVVEDDRGVLHVYSARNLRRREET